MFGDTPPLHYQYFFNFPFFQNLFPPLVPRDSGSRAKNGLPCWYFANTLASFFFSSPCRVPFFSRGSSAPPFFPKESEKCPELPPHTTKSFAHLLPPLFDCAFPIVPFFFFAIRVHSFPFLFVLSGLSRRRKWGPLSNPPLRRPFSPQRRNCIIVSSVQKTPLSFIHFREHSPPFRCRPPPP